MNIVPLDLQRRCEQRWAARFHESVDPTATRGQQFAKQDLSVPGKAKIRNRWVRPTVRTGSKSVIVTSTP
jgi:hypothetical protein